LEAGTDIGMISESGCPGVADPGSSLAQLAHQINAKVKPHVGPNSILLALMASGFNGQHFQFHGYLPNKQPMLNQKLQEIERESKANNVSQFFIETPYRNDQMIKEILKNCHDETRLCVAANLTGEAERIISLPIKKWKQLTVSFHKQPAVFGIYVD
jgi:16S rRNA (cytidine1402-2'-O)-methyltransferase